MLCEFSQQIIGQPADVAGGYVGSDVRVLAHPWDNCAHHWISENESQSHLRHVDSSSLGNRLESVGALNTGN
jgi:hypothetical protein